jgi:hypothetical protein
MKYKQYGFTLGILISVVGIYFLLSYILELKNAWVSVVLELPPPPSIEEVVIEHTPINAVQWSIYTASWAMHLDEKIEEFTQKNEIGNASFLSSFVWDYSWAISQRQTLCAENASENRDFCESKSVVISTEIQDASWSKIPDITTSLHGESVSSSGTQLLSNLVHRVKFSKKGFIDGYKDAIIWNGADGKIDGRVKIAPADSMLTVPSDKLVNHKTDNFEFTILPNSFVTSDGKTVSGSIDIYFFDIGASDGNLSVLNLDAFDDEMNYVWSSFSTLGMPLVKAYSWNQELTIATGIVWKWKIQNLERAPGIDLVTVPKNVYLRKADLDKYKIPPFWHLDQLNWVWKSSAMKILDTEGNYEFTLN